MSRVSIDTVLFFRRVLSTYQVQRRRRDLGVLPVDDFDAVAGEARVVGQEDVVLPQLAVDDGGQGLRSLPAEAAQEPRQIH